MSSGVGATVRAVALDDVFDLRGQRLASKIDVAGYQLDVLRGMQALLTGNRCFLQIEANDRVADELISFMANKGFRYTGWIDIDHQSLENTP